MFSNTELQELIHKEVKLVYSIGSYMTEANLITSAFQFEQKIVRFKIYTPRHMVTLLEVNTP